MKPFFRICRGATRTVWLVGNYAIKFPTFKSYKGFIKGILSNLNERAISSSCPDYFLPVLWSEPTGIIVIMPRCKVPPMDSWILHSFMADLFHHTRDEEQQALDARKYCEYIRGNVGLYKGKPICIDYGTFMPTEATFNAIDREHHYLQWLISNNIKKQLEKQIE